VCFNDIAAIGLVDGLINQGYDVPKDISIVGFDYFQGSFKTENEIPIITTMRQPNDEMASYGVNGLYDMIINNKKGKSKNDLLYPSKNSKRDLCPYTRRY
jgi:LacI family transcriptional regulator